MSLGLINRKVRGVAMNGKKKRETAQNDARLSAHNTNTNERSVFEGAQVE